MPWPGDGDLGGVGVDFNDLIAGGKVARHPRMNLNRTSETRVEGQMQLAGHDGPDRHVARVMDLLRGEIEGTFAGLGVSQVDFRLNFIGPQLADDALRSANAD